MQFGIPLSGSSWEDGKLIRGTTCVLAGRPPPPAQAADFRATAPLELDRAGVCCTSGHFLWSCFLPWGVFLPWPPFPPPRGVFLPSFFPALGSRVRRLLYKLGTHHANSRFVAYDTQSCKTTTFLVRPKVPVFIASFLRFLHCGRYPWLWNDEHVLVLLAVV